jgi:hypothetical protein
LTDGTEGSGTDFTGLYLREKAKSKYPKRQNEGSVIPSLLSVAATAGLKGQPHATLLTVATGVGSAKTQNWNGGHGRGRPLFGES